jgi:hypothetical protein
MYGALKLTSDRVLDHINMLDSPEDFTDLLNHVLSVILWEVGDLKLGVHRGHDLRLLVNHLALSEGSLYEGC